MSCLFFYIILLLVILILVGCGFYLCSVFNLLDNVNVVIVDSVKIYVLLSRVFYKWVIVYGLNGVYV